MPAESAWPGGYAPEEAVYQDMPYTHYKMSEEEMAEMQDVDDGSYGGYGYGAPLCRHCVAGCMRSLGLPNIPVNRAVKMSTDLVLAVVA